MTGIGSHIRKATAFTALEDPRRLAVPLLRRVSRLLPKGDPGPISWIGSLSTGRLARRQWSAAEPLLAANQDLLQVGDHFAIAEGRFVNFGTLDVGSWERIRKLSLLPQARAPHVGAR